MAETRTFTIDRLCAFTDGVFAIAITLLVLDLKVPDTPQVPIREAVLGTLPKFDSWVISFFVIGVLWLRHHVVLTQIKRADVTVLCLNLVLLLIVSFMPWVTSLNETYRHQPLAIILFSGTLGLAWTALTSIWLYAERQGHLMQGRVQRRSRLISTLLVTRGILTALISIGLAYIDAGLALYSWGLLIVFHYVIRAYALEEGAVEEGKASQ
jgi:uncharacterized membrane protein